MNGENLREARCFRYLGVYIAFDGKMGTELCQRVDERAKVLSGLQVVERNVTV